MSQPITETNEYKTLTQVLQILERQREAITKDKDLLFEIYNDALKSPVDFVESLLEGKLKLPGKSVMEAIPNIKIEPVHEKSHQTNGTHSSQSSSSKSSSSKPSSSSSSSKSSSSSSKPSSSSKSSSSSKVSSPISKSSKPTSSSSSLKSSSSSKLSSKSTINLPWAPEEQLKLEKLLVKYPHEEIAQQRWNKISREMGTRTAKQVASRTQKYFAKLQQAGLPIPGNSSQYYSPDRGREDSGNSLKRKLEHSSNSLEPSLKNKKLDSGVVVHEGFRCDGCALEPITGIRWRCEECMEEFDLCGDCRNNYHQIGSHISTHHMTPYTKAINASSSTYYIDTDYKYSYQDNVSNYLDPNYDEAIS